jgi:hypothetical protein
MPGKKGKVYRKGKVHVLSSMCKTCIFRPGNLMHLDPGRVEEMVQGATQGNSTIVCHETLGGLEAACHGFYKLHSTSILQVAERLGFLEWQELDHGPS